MPEQISDEVEFTFSWLALKLLGKGLYSNPWSALSELVANGFDAGASTVWVDVDMRNKGESTIDVIDNGSGMSREGLDTYARVGYNKRDAAIASGAPVDTASLMGRKGIGKLAALYLSPHLLLKTKQGGIESVWDLDVRDGRILDDDRPKMRQASNPEAFPNDGLWNPENTGTYLRLLTVDLRGHGSRAVEGLSTRLANQFLLPEREDRAILLRVRDSQSPIGEFKAVVKSIAYNNLAFVVQSFAADADAPEELRQRRRSVRIPAKGLPDDEFKHDRELLGFPPLPAASEIQIDDAEHRLDMHRRLYTDAATGEQVPFRVVGWIGIHATIEKDEAQINDKRFQKDRFYNPAQLRIYVRGKLASDRLLAQLGITSTYANYIEGELSFDLLDANELPDIATANRQDFDESDDRVTLLKGIVRPMVRDLIKRRTDLASVIRDRQAAAKARRESSAKQMFSELLGQELAELDSLTQQERDDLQARTVQKIQGDTTAKTQYRIFISHASKDKRFSDFLYAVLRERDVKDQEIFYTSKYASIEQAKDTTALSELIRDSIVDSNTLIFYLTSRHFLLSEYCMFEGGAGWATRGVQDYLKLNLDFDSVPEFLTNGRSEISLLQEESIALRPEVYRYLIECILDPMILHLNRGRAIDEDAEIQPFGDVALPMPHQLAAGESIEDHFDADLVRLWNFYVGDDLEKYISSYPTPK